MNNMMKATTLFASLLIVACGGGESGEETAAVEAFVATQDIVAARNFSFELGKEITLSVNYQGMSDGALHLYSQALFTNANAEAVADPMSLITTIYPSKTDEVTLEINSNWQKIYAQWVPMSSNESEKNLVIELDQSNDFYQINL